MTNRLRITLASAVTALFLAAVSAAGVVVHSPRPPAVSASHAVVVSQPQAEPAFNQQEHD